MSDLTASPTALAIGAIIGAGAGLYAHRTANMALTKAVENRFDTSPARAMPSSALTALGATAGLLIGARFGIQARLPAYLYLAAIAPALGAVDAVTRRLPNRILLPAYPAGTALLGFAAWQDGDAGALWRSLLAGALLYAAFMAVALMSPPGSLGWADVKLVGVLGLFLGFLGWTTVWLGIMIAFGLAALYAVLRALVRRGQRGQVLPLGPALLLGSLTAVIVS